MNVLEVKKIKSITDTMMNNFIELDKIIETNPGMIKQEFEMTRQQFRQMKRDNNKTADVLRSLNTKQKDTVQMMLKANERYYLEKMKEAIAAQTASVNATLTDVLPEWSKDVANEFWDNANALFADHLEKKEGKIMTKGELEKLEKEIRNFIFELLDNKVSAKEIKKELEFKFPKMSKAQIKIAYAETKEDWEAANKIYDVIQENKKTKKEANPKKETEIPVKSVKQLDEIIKEVKNVTENIEPVTMSIEEQLKVKLEVFDKKKSEKQDNIKVCEEQIKKLQETINNLKKGISEVEIKVDKTNQMIELAKSIE